MWRLTTIALACGFLCLLAAASAAHARGACIGPDYCEPWRGDCTPAEPVYVPPCAFPADCYYPDYQPPRYWRDRGWCAPPPKHVWRRAKRPVPPVPSPNPLRRDGQTAQTEMTLRRKAAAAGKIPQQYRKMENQVGHTLRAIESGAALYDQHCTVCHGAAGEGNGPRAQDVSAPMPPLTDELVRNSSDAYLIWTIMEGGKQVGTEKPGFSEELRNEQAWQIIAYMRAGFPARAPERPFQQTQSDTDSALDDR